MRLIIAGNHFPRTFCLLIVDKLVYSPNGSLTEKLLPYREPQRGDIIVFRYLPDLKQNLVKRVIGVPGNHIRLESGSVVETE